MKVLKGDHDHRISIPGIAEPVRRPVDIDQAKTGFAALRTLRIYRFEAGAEIHGHAEQDEVFLIVLSGSIELKISGDQREDSWNVFVLSAPVTSSQDAFVAYLPPLAAYELTTRTEADVAYARATPLTSRSAAVFHASPYSLVPGLTLLLEQKTHAERLRIRVLRVDAERVNVTVPLISEAEGTDETLVHFRTLPADGVATIVSASELIRLDSWDTIAVASGDKVSLNIARGGSALTLLIVSAV